MPGGCSGGSEVERKFHVGFGLIYLIILTIIFEKITITILIASMIYCIAPDLDKIWKPIGHRNFIFHGIIPYMFILIYNFESITLTTMVLMFSAAVGFHCLLDCRWMRKKQTGYYTIKINERKGLNGIWSTVWLVGNFILSFSFILIWCLV